jgi:aspartyl-tRNA(Asn)/glutamyl-tRNA(Gln) amidotransferase subunit C
VTALHLHGASRQRLYSNFAIFGQFVKGSMTAKVSLEEVRRVAELANLELTDAEEPRMQRDLNAILEYVAQLNELDTANVPAMAQVTEILDGIEDNTALRQDNPAPSLDRSRVMATAPETDKIFFKVPKVIER